jgi:uncharacterized protein with ATP-grasp and redox domains
LPPLIMTSEPGSFAHNTLRVRIPAILQETIALNSFAQDIRAALEALYAELQGGTIRGLQEDTPDRGFWDQVSAPHIGRTWLDVPWYWAEAFFYRRLLEATRYFAPGPWRGFDPFAAKKETEWVPDAAPATANAVLRALPFDRQARFERLLHASLWGNRTDLSYAVAAHLGGTTAPHDERENLLVDDTAAVWQHLQGQPGRRVAIIADNAGTELVMDLMLADYLLSADLASEVYLHLKPQPFFVSDAMPADVMAGLSALDGGKEAARALAGQLRGALRGGRLRLVTHWSYASSLFYYQIPDDLRRELGDMDLVLVKGDANYRRLLDDAHWPPTTAFADTVAYFPAPVAAFRLRHALLPGPRGRAAHLQGGARRGLASRRG